MLLGLIGVSCATYSAIYVSIYMSAFVCLHFDDRVRESLRERVRILCGLIEVSRAVYSAIHVVEFLKVRLQSDIIMIEFVRELVEEFVYCAG